MKRASGTCQCPIPWLGLPASTAGAQIQSLARELRSYGLHGRQIHTHTHTHTHKVQFLDLSVDYTDMIS